MDISSLVSDINISNATVIGALTIIVGLFSLLHAYFTWRAQTTMSKRNRTVALYDEFYSVNGYSTMVAPVFEVMLKWRSLEEPAKSEYRDAVIRGWVGFYTSESTALNMYSKTLKDETDIATAHFQSARSTEQLTEHEALTAFLYFWSKLELMLKNNVVDAKLTKSLFFVPFKYYQPFIREMRENIDANMSENDIRPSWYSASQNLEKFFDIS